MTQNDALTAKQRRFLELLLLGKSVTKASREAGIGRRTAYRWLRQPAFRETLQEQEAALLAESTRRLLALQERAINEFSRLLDDPLTPAAVRLATARAILEGMLKFYDVTRLEERITALEEAVEQILGKPI